MKKRRHYLHILDIEKPWPSRRKRGQRPNYMTVYHYTKTQLDKDLDRHFKKLFTTPRK